MHDEFMRLALALARDAEAAGEVPVGAVAVSEGAVIGRGRNSPISLNDPSAHAEMLAVREACLALGNYRLEGVTLYSTLEPCVMCAGALVNARVPRVVYGCDDPKAGALYSLYTIGADARLNHRFELTRGVLADTCAAQLSAFFAELRAQKRREVE